MINYFTSFRLLSHDGFNNIQATGVINKNSFREGTIIEDKQLQKKERDHFEQPTSRKNSRMTLTVVDRNNNGVVYIAFSQSFQSKRFVRRLNKVEKKYI